MRKVLALFTLIASTAGAQTTIGTYTPPTLPTSAGGVGPFGTNRVGQGFFAPTGATSLTSLSYVFSASTTFQGGGPGTLNIFAFNGTVPTGASLFSTAFTYPTTQPTSTLTFNPGISVVGGARYIALLGFGGTSSTTESLVYLTSDLSNNTTGDVTYVCFAGTADCATNVPNVVDVRGRIAAFQATFVVAPTAVPEPSTIALAATGLLALAGVARRRRSA